MSEPTTTGLELRLHRLYPKARAVVDGDRWVVFRDDPGLDGPAEPWWLDPTLPRVRYDAQALILSANTAAQAFLGSPLVGHHWQEFVIPGTAGEVERFVDIIVQAGAVLSRFRMPDASGRIVEFDSFTEADGETLTTTMRPRREPAEPRRSRPESVRRAARPESAAEASPQLGR
jgi:hypothetical protein